VFDLFSLQSLLADASLVQRQWSRIAESAGKWAYYPFHDPAVLNAAYATPWDVKLAEPKSVLRGVAKQIGIPDFIITRPKGDFSANRRHWALPGGVLEPLVPLAAKVWGERPLRDVQATTARTLTNPASAAPTAYTFLAMLNYAAWKRMSIGGESLADLVGEMNDAASAARHAGSAKSGTL
jgi:hypothetical protein